MLSIIISSYQETLYANLQKNIADTIGDGFVYEILKIHNPGTMGICVAYNKGAGMAKYPNLLFLHEDVLFHTQGWGMLLLDDLGRENSGVVGIAGSSYVPYAPCGYTNPVKEYNYHHLIQSGKYGSVTLEKLPPSGTPIMALDGVFLALRKSVFGAFPFNEDLPGFHGYDLDFTLRISQKYSNAITSKIRIEHFSSGNPEASRFANMIAIKRRIRIKNPKNDSFNEYSAYRSFVVQLVKYGYTSGQYWALGLRFLSLRALGPVNFFKSLLFLLKNSAFSRTPAKVGQYFALFISVYSVRFAVACCLLFGNKSKKRKGSEPKSILFLENFPVENSGYRYRAGKWAEMFRENGYRAHVLTTNRHPREYDFNHMSLTTFLIKNMWRRFFHILKSMKYDVVVVRRELLLYNDYGNLFLEKFLLAVHPNAILDFDDDIAAAKKQPHAVTSPFAKALGQNGNKFNESLRLYKKFSVASGYLKIKTLQENPAIPEENVCIIPTCVDYDQYPSKTYSLVPNKPLCIGWIGGVQNYPLLDTVLPVLDRLAQKYAFKLLVVGGNGYQRNARFPIEFRQWSLSTEVKDITDMDIGIMPLDDSPISKGKGGFKLIQYMGLGVVGVAGAVTINNEIVDNGVDSFAIENSPEAWETTLAYLLENKHLLPGLGQRARKKIENNYTFRANYRRYESFIYA